TVNERTLASPCVGRATTRPATSADSAAALVAVTTIFTVSPGATGPEGADNSMPPQADLIAPPEAAGMTSGSSGWGSLVAFRTSTTAGFAFSAAHVVFTGGVLNSKIGEVAAAGSGQTITRPSRATPAVRVMILTGASIRLRRRPQRDLT